MYLNQDTQNIQSNLARYCRTGIYTAMEGVSEERVQHYRRLVFNQVKNTLNQAYPITREWLNAEDWMMLIHSFFEHHDSQTPKIWQMPREFMEYVVNKDFSAKLDKPSLNDLLRFEWIEIEVHTMPDVKIKPVELNGDYLKDTLVLAPEYSLQKLEYPVHILNADLAVEKKGDWFVYVFRNLATGVVQFLNISVLHTFILEKLYEKPQPIHKLLPYISSIFGLTDKQQITSHLNNFITDLHKKEAIVGFKRSN